ncbi:PilN domain-containing protein [Bosea sp. 2RAB26]|uniref:PilN domain-containing protein n=1 Tax=Bosea sp. 2RAB26 TaxID=3237476 RepID=UPI003F8EAE6B
MTGSRRLSSGIASLAEFWAKELRASLPDTLRRWAAPDRFLRLVIVPAEEHVTITLFAPDGRELFAERANWAQYSRSVLNRCKEQAASFAPSSRIRLVLSAPQAIAQSLVIPRRAQTRAEGIVREHIARKTPLKPEDIFVGYDLRGAAAGKLELRYLLLPRAVLDQMLARLAVAPSEIATLEGPAFEGLPPVSVPFAQKPHTPSPWFKRIAIALVLLTVLGAVTGYLVLAWRQAQLLKSMEAEIAEISGPAQQSTESLRSVFGLADDVSRLTAQRSIPGIVQVWDEMSRILPDSTFLTELEITGANLRATGYSDAAPALIKLLEESPILHNAALSGPLVFDRATGKENFSLRATLRKARLPTEEGK